MIMIIKVWKRLSVLNVFILGSPEKILKILKNVLNVNQGIGGRNETKKEI